MSHQDGPSVRRYEELLPIDRSELDAALIGRDVDQRVRAILRLALNDDDFELIEQVSLQQLDADDFTVRRAAVLAVGHLARRHGEVRSETVTRVRERGSTN